MKMKLYQNQVTISLIALTASVTTLGVAIPVVSPRVTPLKPIILYSFEISANLLAETFPSKGQPKAVAMSP